MATLQIELEDMAGASWWQGLVATLTAQSGSAYLRFVGRVDGRRQYRGATFSALRTLGTLPPQEAWAPGMTKSLQDLCREIENDGWVKAGQGSEPWALKYERSPTGPELAVGLVLPAEDGRRRRPPAGPALSS